ncbi:MAG: nitrous oxide reductase family maturation protein NosD [Candidatus Aminicenantaceae bacterium]
MRRKMTPLILAVALVLSIGLMLAMPVTVQATINVPDDYTTIQAAIDAASTGETILVQPGIYPENILINKSLILQGIDMPVIDGSTGAASGWAGSVIRIAANNVTIAGFELKDGANGIAGQTSNSVFKNNIIHDNLNYMGSNGIGILLWGDNDNNLIEDNTICNNDRQGIFIGYGDATKISMGNTISGNKIHDNGLYTLPYGPDASAYGIQLWNADENSISRNKIHHHDDWFPYGGTTFDFAQGIYLTNSANNTVTNNDLHHNNYGVGIYSYSRGAGTNSINYNNIFQNTGFGVRSFDSFFLDATNNWWGHRSGPTHSDNPSGKGDKISDYVTYAPWQTKPVTPRN